MMPINIGSYFQTDTPLISSISCTNKCRNVTMQSSRPICRGGRMNSPVPIHRRCSLLLLVVCFAVSCANLPRDPKETLRRVEGGRLRVGLVEHWPWVIRIGGEPAGVEVELVKKFAAGLGATPEWHWGGEQQQMEALEHFQLDLVIGGVTNSTAWSKYVGLTSPYFEERIK